MTPSIMEILKRSTRDQHDQIERALNLEDPTFTLPSYSRLLQRFYGYYRPWEAMCRPLIDELIPGFFAQRLKSPLLEADLVALGYGHPVEIAQCPYLPAFTLGVQALGSMYVIEGSTLGGRVLSRHFSAVLGIVEETGGRFYAGYGERTGNMWREFSSVVNANIDAGSVPDAVQAADDTFRTLRQWLTAAR